MFLPDDRTIVFEDESTIRKMASGARPASPAYLRGPAWERASRGLAALAIKNRDDAFTKKYDFGRPDDKMVLSLFKGIDCWMFGVDDGDSIVFHADATSRSREASESVSRQVDSLIALARQFLVEELDPKSPEVGAHELNARVVKAMAANVRVEHNDKTVTVQTQDFATLADFAAIVEGMKRGNRKCGSRPGKIHRIRRSDDPASRSSGIGHDWEEGRSPALRAPSTRLAGRGGKIAAFPCSPGTLPVVVK